LIFSDDALVTVGRAFNAVLEHVPCLGEQANDFEEPLCARRLLDRNVAWPPEVRISASGVTATHCGSRSVPVAGLVAVDLPKEWFCLMLIARTHVQ
jgi:hypothetical protein